MKDWMFYALVAVVFLFYTLIIVWAGHVWD
jgi:hypothetical protein